MSDQNSANVVFNNNGSGMPEPPMQPYQMQPDYNIDPEGYAGFSNYITNRGDDSKYGAVPRFDALAYDQQFQPYGEYASPQMYGGYAQPAPYPQGYPDAGYGQQSPAPYQGFNGQPQYQADPYQQYDQVYDWQQYTGQVPQLRPTDQYQMSNNSGQFPPVQQQQGYSGQFPPVQPGYMAPRVQQGYAPYAPGARTGIELSDVIDDIIANRGQSQQQFSRTSEFAPPQQDFTGMGAPMPGAYPGLDQQGPAQSQYMQRPTEYQPGGMSPQGGGSSPTFETAVFSLNDIQRQQANSQPMLNRTDSMPAAATTIDFNIPLGVPQQNTAPQQDNMFQQNTAPQQDNMFQQSAAPQQDNMFQQSAAPQQDNMFQQNAAPQQDNMFQQSAAPQQSTMPQQGASVSQQFPAAMPEQQMQNAQPQLPQQQALSDSDSLFGPSFGESFNSQHTLDIPQQPAAPPVGAFAPDVAALDPVVMPPADVAPGASAQPQQHQSQATDTVASDSDMDSLFGAVFSSEYAKNQSTAQIPDLQQPAQPAPDGMPVFSSDPNLPQSQPMNPDAPIYNLPQGSPGVPPVFQQLPTSQDGPFQQGPTAVNDSLFQTDSSIQDGQFAMQPDADIALYQSTSRETMEQDIVSDDFDKDIFESNFRIDEASASGQKPAASVRDTEIFRIAEELSQAVLIKSHSRAFNDNNLMREDNVRLVQVDSISSDYYISEGGVDPYRMFENISLGLNVGSCCALVSDVPLAAYVLARSICESADQDYEDEPVQVADTSDGEVGQIMYIGSDSMLPEEMNVEEFLLYTQTGSSDNDDEKERDRLTALLSQLGMSALQDTDLRELSYNKRILLITLAAALNPNIVCVVINDPKFRVDAEEEMLARRIFALINTRGKCSLIACSSAYLMASVANRVAVVKRGQLEFFGEYKKFLDDYCLGIMSFNSDNPSEMARQIETKYPDLNVLCKENLVYLMKRKGSPDIDLAALIKDVINLGADYNSIVMDEKSFVMACKEALGRG